MAGIRIPESITICRENRFGIAGQFDHNTAIHQARSGEHRDAANPNNHPVFALAIGVHFAESKVAACTTLVERAVKAISIEVQIAGPLGIAGELRHGVHKFVNLVTSDDNLAACPVIVREIIAQIVAAAFATDFTRAGADDVRLVHHVQEDFGLAESPDAAIFEVLTGLAKSKELVDDDIPVHGLPVVLEDNSGITIVQIDSEA